MTPDTELAVQKLDQISDLLFEVLPEDWARIWGDIVSTYAKREVEKCA
jgi:hypothetical protein